MAAKYGDDHYGWRCRSLEGAIGGSLWKGISKGGDSFFNFVRFKINKGDRVSFWKDRWCNKECLKNLFPACYAIAGSKGGSVGEHMIRTRSCCLWNIQPRRNLND